jgi:hypothetical protein
MENKNSTRWSVLCLLWRRRLGLAVRSSQVLACQKAHLTKYQNTKDEIARDQPMIKKWLSIMSLAPVKYIFNETHKSQIDTCSRDGLGKTACIEQELTF